MRKFYAFTAFLLLIVPGLRAQIVINEYSGANKDDFMDDYLNFRDWVELYNAGASSVSLAGYYLSDEFGNPAKYTIPAVTIPAGGYALFICDDKNVSSGSWHHTNFKLTQDKEETIYLHDPTLVPLDSVQMLRTQRNHSRGRKTDGTAQWGVFTNPTPGGANTGAKDEYAPKPVYSAAAGFYPSSFVLSATAPTGNTIRYTTNGFEPTAASPVFSGSIPLPPAGTIILRMKTFSPSVDTLPSFTETNTYFINVDRHGLAVVSVASDDYTNLFSSWGMEIMTSFEYFDTAGVHWHEGDGDVRGHGNDSWAFDQKGIRFYARDEYGYANNIEHQLFNVTPRDEFDVIILKAGASDNYPAHSWLNSCHLRDVFCQTLSQEYNLNLDERSWEPCQLYINGQYWGLYEIRERVDADFTDYYYDQGKDSVDMLAFWGGLTIEEGSNADWNDLYNYMMTHDLSIPANYDSVEKRLDIMSLIDYFIINTYLVNTDWLNWNSAWWRGFEGAGVKWRYRLWDQDNILNLGQNYTGVSTTTYLMDPCDPTTLFTSDPDIPHCDMINALDANTDFHDLYISRYADLLNTAFHCDSMNAHLDSIVDRIAPEMVYQIARWGGSFADWQENLDSIRVQIDGRCMVVDSLMSGCYALTGPYDLTVIVDPPASGDVMVSTLIPSSYPWMGSYYGGVNVNLKALPALPSMKLGWWEFNSHTPTPSIYEDTIKVSLTVNDTVIAHFVDTSWVGFTDITPLQRFEYYPNPATDVLNVAFSLSEPTNMDIALYSLTGTRVATLSSGSVAPGYHNTSFNLSNLGLTAGVYFLRASGEGFLHTGKVVIVE